MHMRAYHAHPMPGSNRCVPVSLSSGLKTQAFHGTLPQDIVPARPSLAWSGRANYSSDNPRIRGIRKGRPSNLFFHRLLPAPRISRIFKISRSIAIDAHIPPPERRQPAAHAFRFPAFLAFELSHVEGGVNDATFGRRSADQVRLLDAVSSYNQMNGEI